MLCYVALEYLLVMCVETSGQDMVAQSCLELQSGPSAR